MHPGFSRWIFSRKHFQCLLLSSLLALSSLSSLLFSAAGYPLASIFNAYAHYDGSLNAWQWSDHPGQLQVTIIIMMMMMMTWIVMMTIMLTKSDFGSHMIERSIPSQDGCEKNSTRQVFSILKNVFYLLGNLSDVGFILSPHQSSEFGQRENLDSPPFTIPIRVSP